MKIEVKGVAGAGYKAAVYEDGKMIPGITEALISIKPDRSALLITEQAVFDAEGRPYSEDGETIKTKYLIYGPECLTVEA